MRNEPSFTDLHQALIDLYDLEELRTLCAQLGVPFDDLRGEGRQARARELILWLERRERLDELKSVLQKTQLARQDQMVCPPGSPQPVDEASFQKPADVHELEDQHVRILHISDIHRAPNAPTSNTTLLGKLLDDTRYTYDEDNARLGPGEPRLGTPDLIVISGDLTQRADEAEFEVALRFLEGLLPLVNGDRRRIVLVPGNHDVNWAIAAQSYTPTTKEDYDHSAGRQLYRSLQLSGCMAFVGNMSGIAFQ